MSAESGSVTRHADHFKFYTSERASLERPRFAGAKPVIETGRGCLLV